MHFLFLLLFTCTLLHAMDDGCPGGMSMWELECRAKERKKYRRKSVFIVDGQRINPKSLSKEELTAKLHKAIRRENLKAIKTCIALGADCNALARLKYDLSFHGFPFTTPLMWAIENKRCSKSLISELIKRTTNLEHTNKSGYTALSLACIHLPAKICKRLLKSGANPNVEHSKYCLRTPLALAVDYSSREVIALLLNSGVQFEFTDFINGMGEIRIDPDTINALIQTPLFLPCCKDKDFPEFEKTIIHTILSLKKACPALPRDVLYSILNCEETSHWKCLHCSFKTGNQITQMPIQTIHKLVRDGRIDREKTVSRLQDHCFAQLKPMLKLALDIVSEYESSEEKDTLKKKKQERIDLLNPHNLEKLHGAAIDANIREALKRK